MLKVQLDVLELDLGRNFVVGHNILTQLLRYQSSLRELNLFKDAGLSQEMIKQPVQQSHQHLVYLHLGIDTRMASQTEPTLIDCTIFETCSYLRKLGIFGIARIREDVTKEVINMDKLCNRILAFVFKNVHVGSEDLENLIYRMRHIVKLYCDNIGSSNGLGMKLELLKKIIEERKCREVIVKGFNPEDATVEANTEFARTYEVHAASHFPHCHFHAKLNDELGQYISICM